MKVALINPPWEYRNSIYFGCRAAHLPLELGYAKALLETVGHDVLMLDGPIQGYDTREIAAKVKSFRPAMTVVTTAPSYLFWRCAPPELRVPQQMLAALRSQAGVTIAVGPHGSATPAPVLRKLGVDIVVRGECEEVIAALAETPERRDISGIAYLGADGIAQVVGEPAATRFTDTPALNWPQHWVMRHEHHHHRFGTTAPGPGAEVEASRGCPYACTFCAKIDFRDRYRKRELRILLKEIDGLITQGVSYLYFIDEIFLPRPDLLHALRIRNVEFGIQTRIDLWQPEMLDLLGAAGCVSIEAGVESLTVEGRALLAKKCRLDTEQLSALLFHARRSVPFVQANLIRAEGNEMGLVAAWRAEMERHGVWANDPVPLFPYPSAPEYRRLWGAPDDQAWERALDHYLQQFDSFSDIQDERPLPLNELERT
ncbi:MAG TPA: TIGR04295 family B12-binding domain-containing radical SAM protein [Rhizomicrobium sp.]|jgi:B12-binding domain/radical SAM domain protein of rhizo-twelve system|nr:TIGR04295 family B12-binding domain-containing radical SAM protein [Rhizomicrobium sp.]